MNTAMIEGAAYLGVILATAGVALQTMWKRRPAGTDVNAKLDDIAETLESVAEATDRFEHELATLRQITGYAQAHSESTATSLREHRDETAKKLTDLGEATHNRMTHYEERLSAFMEQFDKVNGAG